jgi:hypothetical protein
VAAFTAREVAAFKRTAFPEGDARDVITQIPSAFFHGLMSAIKNEERKESATVPATANIQTESLGNPVPAEV